MYKKGYGKRYAKKRYAGRRKAAPKSTMASVKKLVKQELSRNLEVKQSNYSANNLSVNCPGSGSPGSGGVYNITTSLNQGVTQGTRVGNQVKIKSAMFRGQINLLPYNSLTNPVNYIDVAIYVVKSKINNTGTPDWTKFFQGGATSQGFVNAPTDMFNFVNTENFRMCTKRIFRLSQNTSNGIGDGVTGMARSFTIPVYKYLKKIHKFDDANAAPINDNLWLLIIPVQTDGGSSDVTPVELHFSTTYTYTDA